MSVTSTNLIQGPATLYWAPFGTTEPVTLDGEPGAEWIDLGGTKEGITLSVSSEWSELTVDQIVDVVERRRTGRAVSIGTSLAEATLDNLARAYNNAQPAAGGEGESVLELDDGLAAFAPAYGAILCDGIAPGGLRRRIIVRKTLSTESVESAYKKDDQTLVPVTFAMHWVSASVRPFKIIDATA